MNKFRNTVVLYDGEKFDSRRELKRWLELKILERAKEITHLSRQVTYPIKIGDALICKYIADFEYMERGQLVVEDVKSEITRKDPTYRLKNKLMRAVNGIEIREVL